VEGIWGEIEAIARFHGSYSSPADYFLFVSLFHSSDKREMKKFPKMSLNFNLIASLIISQANFFMQCDENCRLNFQAGKSGSGRSYFRLIFSPGEIYSKSLGFHADEN